MKPELKVMADLVDTNFVNLYIKIRYKSEVVDLPVAKNFPKFMSDRVLDIIKQNEGDASNHILQIQDDEVFVKHRSRLLLLYLRVKLIEDCSTVERSIANLMSRDFDLKAIGDSYRNLVKDSDFIENDSTNVDVDFMFEKIELSSDRVMGDYAKLFYSFLIKKLGDSDETKKTTLRTESLRRVLNCKNKYDRAVDLERGVLNKIVLRINSATNLYITNINKDQKTNPTKYTITYSRKLEDVEFPDYTLTSNDKRGKVVKSLSYDKAAYLRKGRRVTSVARDLPKKLSYIADRRAFIYELNLGSWNNDIIPGNIIYFLIREDKVVYVGKSNNELHKRLSKHISSKDFDRVLFIPGPDSEDKLRVLEAYFIYKLLPVENKRLELLFEEDLTMESPAMQNYIE